jgi:hypothetical protein
VSRQGARRDQGRRFESESYGPEERSLQLEIANRQGHWTISHRAMRPSHGANPAPQLRMTAWGPPAALRSSSRRRVSMRPRMQRAKSRSPKRVAALKALASPSEASGVSHRRGRPSAVQWTPWVAREDGPSSNVSRAQRHIDVSMSVVLAVAIRELC